MIISELGGKKPGIQGAGGVQKRKKTSPANLAAAREHIKSIFSPAAISKNDKKLSKNDKKLSNNDKKKERYFSISLSISKVVSVLGYVFNESVLF